MVPAQWPGRLRPRLQRWQGKTAVPELRKDVTAVPDFIMKGPPTDPTKLTQEAVDRASHEWQRELAALREIFETRLTGMDVAVKLLAEQIEKIPKSADTQRDHMREDFDRQVLGLRELLEGRIDGMDRATRLLASNVEKIPSDVDRAVDNLREFIMGQITNSLAETRRVGEVALEKFTAIDGTFGSNALALTAALAAQKEAAAEQNKSNTLAITKSEVATKEKIDSNAAQTQTSITSLADRVDDLKGRMDRGEGTIRGSAQMRDEHRIDISGWFQAISVIIAFATVIVVLFHK